MLQLLLLRGALPQVYTVRYDVFKGSANSAAAFSNEGNPAQYNGLIYIICTIYIVFLMHERMHSTLYINDYDV